MSRDGEGLYPQIARGILVTYKEKSQSLSKYTIYMQQAKVSMYQHIQDICMSQSIIVSMIQA